MNQFSILFAAAALAMAPSSWGQVPAQASPAGGTFAAQGPTPATLENGETFYAGYIVDYWKQPVASWQASGNPSKDAPGHVQIKPALGGAQKHAGSAEMRLKMEKILAQLLKHPALKDVRGVSLGTGGGFYREKGSSMGPILAAHLTINAYPINLNDPATRRFEDGTYATPGEGDVLRISINDPDMLERRGVNGTYNGAALVSRGNTHMLVVSANGRPLGVGQPGQEVVNPDLLDTTRPRTEIQFMSIHVGAASSTWSEIVRKRVAPTSPVGRLIGVAYTTDWNQMLRDVR